MLIIRASHLFWTLSKLKVIWSPASLSESESLLSVFSFRWDYFHHRNFIFFLHRRLYFNLENQILLSWVFSLWQSKSSISIIVQLFIFEMVAVGAGLIICFVPSFASCWWSSLLGTFTRFSTWSIFWTFIDFNLNLFRPLCLLLLASLLAPFPALPLSCTLRSWTLSKVHVSSLWSITRRTYLMIWPRRYLSLALRLFWLLLGALPRLLWAFFWYLLRAFLLGFLAFIYSYLWTSWLACLGLAFLSLSTFAVILASISFLFGIQASLCRLCRLWLDGFDSNLFGFWWRLLRFCDLFLLWNLFLLFCLFSFHSFYFIKIICFQRMLKLLLLWWLSGLGWRRTSVLFKRFLRCLVANRVCIELACFFVFKTSDWKIKRKGWFWASFRR